MSSDSRPAASAAYASTVRGASTPLVVLGLLLATVYAAASARIPLTRYFPDPGISVDFVYMLGPGWERATVEYVSLVLVTFALYLAAVALVRWWLPRPSAAVVFGLAALAALALLPMYPPTAVDMLHYQAMARIAWVFHANPLITPQGAYPYPIGISWSDTPSPYGPLWSVITWPAAVLPGESLLAGLFAFKLLAAAAYLGCAALIWRIVRRTQPGAEAFATLLFAWNPFVLLRLVGNGHNDGWMLLFVLLALDAAQRRHWVWAIEALALSVLVKYATALLGPPLLIYIWVLGGDDLRSRARPILLGGLLAAGTAVLAYAPFFAGVATFQSVLSESQHMITSTPVLLEYWIEAFMDDPDRAANLARLLTRLVFLAVYFALIYRAGDSLERLVTTAFTVLFLYLLIAAAWYRPWYMLWPVTLAALRPRSGLPAVLLTATLAGAFPDLIEQYRLYWPPIASYGRALLAPIVVAFVPPLLVWLLAVRRARGWGLGARLARVERIEAAPTA